MSRSFVGHYIKGIPGFMAFGGASATVRNGKPSTVRAGGALAAISVMKV